MFMDSLKKTIKKYDLIRSGDSILAGVSGGPDSLTLLYTLNTLRKELNFSLHVAHLDHMLRKNSAADRKFVEKICRKLDLPVTTARVDIKKQSKNRSIEEAAREARFNFFFRVAKKTKSAKIALGHNLDDQAETVLMRLLRGSGLSGLSGILPKREMNGFLIIRPLIETRRRDIEKFLKRKGIRPRIDSTNAQDIYFRNNIRNKLMPLLERAYNPNIKTILSNTAESIGQDYDLLNRYARIKLSSLGRELKLNKLRGMHPSERRMVLRLAFQRLKGNMRTITFKHIQELEDLIDNRPSNSIVDLPGSFSVLKKKNTLVFYRR
jgi:tRNA(Ile)-lysidine synthase